MNSKEKKKITLLLIQRGVTVFKLVLMLIMCDLYDDVKKGDIF